MASRKHERDIYDRLSPADIRNVAFTIAGEIDPRVSGGGAPYGTGKNQQEIADILQVIDNRAKERDLTPSKVVKERLQFSMWNSPQGRAAAAANLKKYGPDILSGMSGYYSGAVQPSNTRLDHYYASKGFGKIPPPSWAPNLQPLAQTNQHLFLGPQLDTATLDAQREQQVAQARRGQAPPIPAPDRVADIFNAPAPAGMPDFDKMSDMELNHFIQEKKSQVLSYTLQHPELALDPDMAERLDKAGIVPKSAQAAPPARPANPIQPPMQMGVNSAGPTGFLAAGIPSMSQAEYEAATNGPQAPSRPSPPPVAASGAPPTAPPSLAASGLTGSSANAPPSFGPASGLVGQNNYGAAVDPSQGFASHYGSELPQSRTLGQGGIGTDALAPLHVPTLDRLDAAVALNGGQPSAAQQAPLGMSPAPVSGAQALGMPPAPLGSPVATGSPQIRPPMDLTGSAALGPQMPPPSATGNLPALQSPYDWQASASATPEQRMAAVFGPTPPAMTQMPPVSATASLPPPVTAEAQSPLAMAPVAPSGQATPAPLVPPPSAVASGPIPINLGGLSGSAMSALGPPSPIVNAQKPLSISPPMAPPATLASFPGKDDLSLGPPAAPKGDLQTAFPGFNVLPGTDLAQGSAIKPTPVSTVAVNAIPGAKMGSTPFGPPMPAVAPPSIPSPAVGPPPPGMVPNPANGSPPSVPGRINLAGAPKPTSKAKQLIHAITHPISAVTGIPTTGQVIKAGLQGRPIGGIFGGGFQPPGGWSGGGMGMGGYGGWGGMGGGYYGNGYGYGGGQIGWGIGGGWNPNK